jgi:hypothetical protein
MFMETNRYANISQRVLATYLFGLAPFEYVPAEGISEPAQRELHGFFKSLYTAAFEQPGAFGLPLGADDALWGDEADAKEKKQVLKKKLDKPRAGLQNGLEFLFLAGLEGIVEGELMRIADEDWLLKTSKVEKKFTQGLDELGVSLRTQGGAVCLEAPRFPGMLAVLKALAQACAKIAPPHVGRFQFARCDLRALDGYSPQPTDLLRSLGGENTRRSLMLHEYFIGRNYIPLIGIHSPSQWLIQYQGDRKVKSTPLFQFDYDERNAARFVSQIKCASTTRIAPLLTKQPEKLQADFFRRVFNCNGDACGWCRNRKTLAPSVIEYGGETRTVCWFSNGDFRVLDDEAIELVKLYEQMHAELAQMN